MSVILNAHEVNRVLGTMRRHAVEHPFHADVFVDIRPMHALPVADKLKWVRCVGVASNNRQDHTSGTLITRPSTRYAMMVSDVTLTFRIRDSVLATMLCLT
jgi:hypothetical protein